MLRRVRPLRALARAKRLFRQGRFDQAAEIFDQLAHGAEINGLLDRAGDLHLQAARCYLKLEDIDAADERATKAIRLFLRAGRPGKVRRLLPKVMAALERKGRRAEAEELRREVEALIAPLPGGLVPGHMPGELPAKCSSCGAPVKPNEVNWLDPRSAECPYCGSVIKASG